MNTCESPNDLITFIVFNVVRKSDYFIECYDCYTSDDDEKNSGIA